MNYRRPFYLLSLKYLSDWTTQRQEIAEWYNESLNGIEELVLPKVNIDATHVYHLYVIRTIYRDELQKYLENKGIGTLIHYPIPPHLQKAFAYLGHKKGDFPIAELFAETSLSLPVWPGMTKTMVEDIAEAIKTFFINNK